MALDATTEFDEKVEDQTPESKPETDEGGKVSREEMDALKAAVAEKSAKIEELGGIADVVGKLQALFGGKQPDKPLSQRDEYVRKEILRIAPELGEVGTSQAQINKILPVLISALEATVEERVAEKAEEAQDHMRSLMKGAGLNAADDDAAGYLEEAVTREIRTNKELLNLWTRGNVKSAVNKAFEKVQTKLFAPVRAGAKRSAVSTITESIKPSPRSGGTTSGAESGGGKPKVDLTDTSREGIRKIHDGAFDHLQELLNQE